MLLIYVYLGIYGTIIFKKITMLKNVAVFKENLCNFDTIFLNCKIGEGEMSEWFKEHAWKVCILQKGIAGSNPALSAKSQILTIEIEY